MLRYMKALEDQEFSSLSLRSYADYLYNNFSTSFKEVYLNPASFLSPVVST